MVLQIGQHRIRIVDVLESDNCKSADYPLKLWFRIPDETVTIEKLQLVYLLEKFRAYTSATAATTPPTVTSEATIPPSVTSEASLASHTHNVPGSSHSHSITGQSVDAAGGSSQQEEYSSGISSATIGTDFYTIGSETFGATEHTSLVLCRARVYCQDVVPPESMLMYARVYDGTEYFPNSTGTPFNVGVYQGHVVIMYPKDAAEKTIRLQVRYASGSHLTEWDTFIQGKAAHSHTITGQSTEATIPPTVTSEAGGSSHTHNVPGSSHTHNVPGSTHTHDMTYDIYEQSYSSPSISIKIDGVDRTSDLGGPFTAEGKVLDITNYVTTPGLHLVEIIPNQLMRITGHVFGRCIIGFAGEVAKVAGRYNYSFYNYTVYG